MNQAGHSGERIIRSAFLKSIAVIAVVAIAGLLLYLYLNRTPDSEPVMEADIQAPVVRSKPAMQPPAFQFTDITREAGIDFIHVNGAYGDKLLPETMGGGVGFTDYDNDGDQDLILVNSRRWPDHEYETPLPSDVMPTTRLYRNDGNGRFTDVTAQVGLALHSYGMGVVIGDVDNDGWEDVYITTLGKNHLYRNDNGSFVEMTEDSGAAGTRHEWSTAGVFFDYDRDGDLDLFVANYVDWSPTINRQIDFNVTGLGRAYGAPLHYNGVLSHLYRNDGNFRFTDVSEEAGINQRGKPLGAIAVDYDRDGWLDLFVANDTVRNFLYRNLGDGRFEEIGMIEGIAFERHGKATGAMGIDAAWYRNDDELGIAIGNFANEMSSLYLTVDGRAPFADEAVLEGLGASSRLALTFGLFFFDADLDGRQDLLQVNGHLEEDINSIQPSQNYEQPAQLFWNCGNQCDNRFVLVEETGDLYRPLVSRGTAYADIDLDGDLDVIITQPGRRPVLLRNDTDTDHHWLRVSLQGTSVNHDAIGAIIEVSAGGIVQKKTLMPSRSYLSQVEMPVVFGLGDAESVDSLTVTWPNGKRSSIRVDQVDTTIHISE